MCNADTWDTVVTVTPFFFLRDLRLVFAWMVIYALLETDIHIAAHTHQLIRDVCVVPTGHPSPMADFMSRERDGRTLIGGKTCRLCSCLST